MAENDTLFKLLSDLKKADDELLEFTKEEHLAKVNQTNIKVDSCKYIDVKFDSRIRELQDQIEELQGLKKSYEKGKDAFRKRLLDVLKIMNLEGFPGKDWRLVISKKTELDVLGTPDPKLFLAYGEDFVNREYSWKKNEVKAAYKLDKSKFSEYIRERESESIKFSPKKGEL